MVSFTVSLLSWLGCALFRLFVIVGTGYGVYSFCRDKIKDKKRVKYIKQCQENRKKEYQGAKERISKQQKKKKEH